MSTDNVIIPHSDFAKMVAEIDRLRAVNSTMLAALKQARNFIVNGVYYGYIRLPDDCSNDTANRTLPMIEAAIAEGEKTT